MRLRTLRTATMASALASALAVGGLGVPAHSTTAPPAANAGNIVTWGDQTSPSSGQAIPVPPGLGPVVSIAASQNVTGVVTLDGAVRVWGNPALAEVAAQPSDVDDATAITLTGGNAAVLHADGRVTAWGNTASLRDVPTDLRAKAISLQPTTGYAVRPDGTLTTWGDAPFFPLPEPVPSDLVDVSSAQTHSLALRSDGTIETWGYEVEGLHDVPDFEGKKVVKIATAHGYSGVVLDDGTIEIWGADFGLPSGAPATTFDGLTPATTVIDLSLGTNAVALTADGTVHSWGSNAAVKAVPASLDGQPVSAVAAGFVHAAAVVTSFRELTKPTVTGTPQVNQTLSATPATFSLAPDAAPTGQWYADADPIAGQTGTTLSLGTAQLGKMISYRTTATRGGDSVSSSSAAVGPVIPALVVDQPRPAKANAKVIAKAKATGKTKKIARKVTVAVTVRTTKGVSPAGKVTVTLKGKTKKKATIRVNAKGKGKATFKRIKRGKYTVTLKYSGNAKVKKANGKAKFKA